MSFFLLIIFVAYSQPTFSNQQQPCPNLADAAIKIGLESGVLTGGLSGLLDGGLAGLSILYSWPTAVESRDIMIKQMLKECTSDGNVPADITKLAENVGDMTAWITWAGTTAVTGGIVAMIYNQVKDNLKK